LTLGKKLDLPIAAKFCPSTDSPEGAYYAFVIPEAAFNKKSPRQKPRTSRFDGIVAMRFFTT
jgi:hypothetical protein